MRTRVSGCRVDPTRLVRTAIGPGSSQASEDRHLCRQGQLWMGPAQPGDTGARGPQDPGQGSPEGKATLQRGLRPPPRVPRIRQVRALGAGLPCAKSGAVAGEEARKPVV